MAKWRAKHSLLRPNPRRNDLFRPVLEAIEVTSVFQRVAGQPLFIGYAGVVITANRSSTADHHGPQRRQFRIVDSHQ